MPFRHYSALKYRRVSADIFYMPRGSAPIIPRGSAFRICLFHRQIHGSRRRARARLMPFRHYSALKYRRVSADIFLYA